MHGRFGKNVIVWSKADFGGSKGPGLCNQCPGCHMGARGGLNRVGPQGQSSFSFSSTLSSCLLIVQFNLGLGLHFSCVKMAFCGQTR